MTPTTGSQRTNGQAGNRSVYTTADQSRPAHAVGVATGRALRGDPGKNVHPKPRYNTTPGLTSSDRTPGSVATGDQAVVLPWLGELTFG